MTLLEVQVYILKNGKMPFLDWKAKLQKREKIAVDSRITRAANGLLGDSKSVGGGVFEMRIALGPGYRIYFSIVDDNKILLLFTGGDKSSQQKDIEKAKSYLKDWKS